MAWTPPQFAARIAYSVALLAAMILLSAAPAMAGAPLSQGFEDGAPAWSATGMWHVQADPQDISVIPEIAGRLVTLADAGRLPAAVEGSHVAWFGEPSTGTYCGSDFATIKQTPNDGCTSTEVERGTLTSPSFSLAGRSSAYVAFRAWWEIEAVHADVADLMRVEYSIDGGTTWVEAGRLNPLDPAWGGKHQPFTDDGARTSASWQAYAADLSAAAGQSDVRVRFNFDSVDRLRNGFRGFIVDGVALVDALGATITDPDAGPFTDAPPSVSVTDPKLEQDVDGHWTVKFTVTSSHPAAHPIGVDWVVKDHSDVPVGTGHVTIDPGQTAQTVTVPVSGDDAPYVASIADPTGGTIAPGGSSAPTPGGALPRVRLSSLGVAPAGNGLVTVSIEASLDQPALVPVSVVYTVTGSDGVQVATAPLVIPAGDLSASTSVTVSSEHAPYTVALSDAQGALLDSGIVGTTSPLAGVTAVATPATSVTTPAAGIGGEQLVLGIRQTGSSPDLDGTFVLTVVSGTILYHRPGEAYQELKSGSITLPLGSVVDATNGHALVTVEVDAQHTLQQAELSEGRFGVFQVGSPAITELRLAGGDYSACAQSSRKRAKRSASKTIRHLWASAKGSFRTKGRYASATIRGTRWLTEDLCLATRITVADGVVTVRDFRRHRILTVKAGDSRTIGALNSARYRTRRGIHGPRLSATG
jgi:hypothetical protein